MTMNCTDTKALFDDLLDGELSLPQMEAVQRHLAACGACREALKREQAFRTALKAADVPPPAAGFTTHALANARRKATAPRRQAFAAGFGSAVAAVLVVWFGVNTFHHGAVKNGAIPTVSLALAQPEMVRIVFTAPRDFPDATLTIVLPSHTELKGYPGKQEVVWRSSLYKGRNMLTLPLEADQKPGGNLIAKIHYGTDTKTFRLRLKTQPLQQSMNRSVAI